MVVFFAGDFNWFSSDVAKGAIFYVVSNFLLSDMFYTKLICYNYYEICKLNRMDHFYNAEHF